MKVWEVSEEHCFGIALVAAKSKEEAIKIVEEYMGVEDCPWTNNPQYYALESQDLVYKQDSPEILYNYLDV